MTWKIGLADIEVTYLYKLYYTKQVIVQYSWMDKLKQNTKEKVKLFRKDNVLRVLMKQNGMVQPDTEYT